MKIKMYQVDTFTNELFAGNPVEVCLTEGPLSPELMHKIAVENNLSETAFCYKDGDIYRIRWFTPEVEIDLCGHATLGTAHVLFNQEESGKDKLVFATEQCGNIEVTREGKYICLEFPIREGKPIPFRQDVAEALGGQPQAFYESRDIMVVYNTPEEVCDLTPEVTKVNNLGVFGIIATAPGKDVDFVSRYFAPGCGVFEDPATGSSHCTLVPYWAKVLNKKEFVDKQLSKRVGTFHCNLLEDKIILKGEAVQLFATEFTL